MRFLKQNTATRVTVGPFIAVANGTTPLTAITATSEHLNLVVDDAGVPTLVLDATATASGGNNDLVFITGSNAGFCDLELTAAQTNYVGRAMLSINYVTDHLPVFHEFMIVPANVYDSLFGTDLLDVSVVQNAGTAITSAAGIQEVKVASIAANAITATSINADAITDAKVASDVTIASVTGAVGSVTGAVGSVTGAVGSVTGNVGGNVTGSVGSVVATVQADIDKINGVTITGDGQSTTEFGV